MPIDISVVMDKTKSLGTENFIKMKETVAGMMEQFHIGKDFTHVSVMTYAGNPTTYNELGDRRYFSGTAVKNLILGINNKLGNPTRTDLAMVDVRDRVFVDRAGDRPGVTNLMILFTDGGTKQPESTPYEEITPGMDVSRRTGLSALLGSIIFRMTLVGSRNIWWKPDWHFQ